MLALVAMRGIVVVVDVVLRRRPMVGLAGDGIAIAVVAVVLAIRIALAVDVSVVVVVGSCTPPSRRYGSVK